MTPGLDIVRDALASVVPKLVALGHTPTLDDVEEMALAAIAVLRVKRAHTHTATFTDHREPTP